MKKFKLLIPSLILLGVMSVLIVRGFDDYIQMFSDHPITQSLEEKLDKHQAHYQTEKVYLQFDRKFFKPGDDIWLKAYVRDAQSLKPSTKSGVVYVEFINPKGTIEKTSSFRVIRGGAAGEFQLPADAVGGLYKIRAYTSWQKNREESFECEIQVQKSVLPNLNMELNFEQKAYGPGDEVVARLDLNSLTNQPLKNHAFDFVVSLNGKEIKKIAGTTQDIGRAYLKFDLPKELESNDGLLNVMLQYKGQTESISRSIPITLGNIDLQFFPEGGDCVAGLPANFGFKAINEFGKAADIEGHIIDELGNRITSFSSYHMGMGQFKFTPSRGKGYYAQITKPEGISKKYKLPAPAKEGYSVRLTKQNKAALSVEVLASQSAEVHLVAQSRNKIHFTKTLSAHAGTNFVYIPTSGFPIGITQLTLFNSKEEAISERLVFVNPHKQLKISVKTNKEKYLPREKVEMEISVRDENDQPVAGNFSIAVTDDKLLTFADDKQGHILSNVLLESDLKGELEEPNFYFDDESDANRPKPEISRKKALDNLLLTQGWRRFAWQEVVDEKTVEHKYPSEPAILSGLVYDNLGKPVEGITVTVVDENKSVKTNKDGRFSFDNVIMDESVTLRAEGNGYNPAYQIATNFKTEPILYVNNNRWIMGDVRDEKTGDPLYYSIAYGNNAEMRENVEKNKKNYNAYNYAYGSSAYTNTNGKFMLSMPGGYDQFIVGGHHYDSKTAKYTYYEYKSVELTKEDNYKIELRSMEDLYKEDKKRWKASALRIMNFAAGEDLSMDSVKLLYDKTIKGQWNSYSGYYADGLNYNGSDLLLEDISVIGSSGGLGKGGGGNRKYLKSSVNRSADATFNTITSADIQNMPTRNLSSIATTTSGVNQIDRVEILTTNGSRTEPAPPEISEDLDDEGSLGTSRIETESKEEVIEESREKEKSEKAKIADKESNDSFDKIMLEEADKKKSNKNYGAKDIAYKVPLANNYWKQIDYQYKTPVEKMPYFSLAQCEGNRKQRQECSDRKLLSYIYDKMEYPEDVKKIEKEEYAIIRFTVDQYGTAYSQYLMNYSNYSLGQAALKAFAELPVFEPAKRGGMYTATTYDVKINYKPGAEKATLAAQTPEDELPRPYGMAYAYKRQPCSYQKVREFYAPQYKSKEKVEMRTDFRSTIYWNPNLEVGEDGKAKVEFYNSDDITQFRTTIEGFGNSGQIGRSEYKYFTQMPFEMTTKVPNEVLTGDLVRIPLTLTNNTEETVEGELIIAPPINFEANNPPGIKRALPPGHSETVYLEYRVKDTTMTGTFKIGFRTGSLSDITTTKIKTKSRGFPVYEVFAGDQMKQKFEVHIQEPLGKSVKARLKVYNSVMDEMAGGMEKMIRMPYGCFEQTSSITYPNVLALSFMRETNTANPQIETKARKAIDACYKRLSGFQCKEGGFEWWGKSPANEEISAYALLEFTDIAKVWPVDKAKLIDRNMKWLLSRRDGKGGWLSDNRKAYTWSFENNTTRSAYIVWAFCEAGYADKVTKEVNQSYNDVIKSEDPYAMALMANALYASGDKSRGATLLNEIVKMQAGDGSFEGLSTMTYSGGRSKVIETTSLVALAMLKSGKYGSQTEKAIQSIQNAKSYYGYGSTQGTILALKALVEYAKKVKKNSESGNLVVYVDGKKVAKVAYKPSQKEIGIPHLEKYLKEGKQNVEVRYEGTSTPIPFDIELTYTTRQPRNSKECAVSLSTDMSKQSVGMGETVRLVATIKNITKEDQPMTMMMVGVPAGLSLQPWQLKELQDKNLCDYYELYEGYAVFHYKALRAGESKVINLDLKADIPGEYEAPASSAFLYYTNEHRVWSAPEKMTIK